jgi:hypothetical protein
MLQRSFYSFLGEDNLRAKCSGDALSTTRENTFCVVSLFVFCELYKNWNDNSGCVFEAKDGAN